jgi:hypothetical protein
MPTRDSQPTRGESAANGAGAFGARMDYGRSSNPYAPQTGGSASFANPQGGGSVAPPGNLSQPGAMQKPISSWHTPRALQSSGQTYNTVPPRSPNQPQPVQPYGSPLNSQPPELGHGQPMPPSAAPSGENQMNVNPRVSSGAMDMGSPYQPTGQPQQNFTQPNVTQQQGFQPSPPQQQGFQPGLPQQQGFQPSPAQQQGFQPSPPQQQGFQPGSPQQQGFQPSPAQQQGFQPSPAQQQGFQPGPPQQQGFQPSPPQQQGFQPNQAYQWLPQEINGGQDFNGQNAPAAPPGNSPISANPERTMPSNAFATGTVGLPPMGQPMDTYQQGSPLNNPMSPNSSHVASYGQNTNPMGQTLPPVGVSQHGMNSQGFSQQGTNPHRFAAQGINFQSAEPQGVNPQGFQQQEINMPPSPGQIPDDWRSANTIANTLPNPHINQGGYSHDGYGNSSATFSQEQQRQPRRRRKQAVDEDYDDEEDENEARRGPTKGFFNRNKRDEEDDDDEDYDDYDDDDEYDSEPMSMGKKIAIGAIILVCVVALTFLFATLFKNQFAEMFGGGVSESPMEEGINSADDESEGTVARTDGETVNVAKVNTLSRSARSFVYDGMVAYAHPGGGVYVMTNDYEDVTKVSDEEASQVYLNDDWCYYETADGIFRMYLDGNGDPQQIVYEDYSEWAPFYVYDGYVYYARLTRDDDDYEYWSVCRIDEDAAENNDLADTNVRILERINKNFIMNSSSIFTYSDVLYDDDLRDNDDATAIKMLDDEIYQPGLAEDVAQDIVDVFYTNISVEKTYAVARIYMDKLTATNTDGVIVTLTEEDEVKQLLIYEDESESAYTALNTYTGPDDAKLMLIMQTDGKMKMLRKEPGESSTTVITNIEPDVYTITGDVFYYFTKDSGVTTLRYYDLESLVDEKICDLTDYDIYLGDLVDEGNLYFDGVKYDYYVCYAGYKFYFDGDAEEVDRTTGDITELS